MQSENISLKMQLEIRFKIGYVCKIPKGGGGKNTSKTPRELISSLRIILVFLVGVFTQENCVCVWGGGGLKTAENVRSNINCLILFM